MAGKKLLMVNLLFPKDKLTSIINDAGALSVMDVSKPLLAINELDDSSLIKTETISLNECNVDLKELTVLATERTYYLTGWISRKSEQVFTEMISNHVCAWELTPPGPDELKNAPVILRRPKFLYGLYKGERPLFSPITLNEPAPEPAPEPVPEDEITTEVQNDE